MFKVQSSKFKVACAVLSATFAGHAQIPTNHVAPSALHLIVDTNGSLLAPTNFWSRNASNINAVVTGGGGPGISLPLSAANGGLGIADTNAIPPGAAYSSTTDPNTGLPFYFARVAAGQEYYLTITNGDNDLGVSWITNSADPNFLNESDLGVSGYFIPTNQWLYVVGNTPSSAVGITIYPVYASLYAAPPPIVPGGVVSGPVTNAGSELGNAQLANFTGTTQSLEIDSTNGFPAAGTISGTAGSFLITISGSTFTPANGWRVGTQVIFTNISPNQYIVTASNSPTSFTIQSHPGMGPLAATVSGTSVTIFPPQIVIRDSTPREVAFQDGDGTLGINGEGLINNSGQVLWLEGSNSFAAGTAATGGVTSWALSTQTGSILVVDNPVGTSGTYYALHIDTNGIVNARFGESDNNLTVTNPPTLMATNTGSGISVGTTAVAGFITITNNGRLCKIPYY